MRPRHPRRGMTLIEVLVSVMISTILVTAAYGIYVAAANGWSTSRRRMDMHQRARVSLDLIGRCLRAAAVSEDTAFLFEGENVEAEMEDGVALGDGVLPAQDVIAFRTNAPLYLPGEREAPDQTRLEFFLEAPLAAEEDAPLSLAMKIDANLEEDTAETGWLMEICEGIEELNFRYFDGTEWVDDWSSSLGVPRVVEVTLVVADMEGHEDSRAFARLCPIAAWRELDGGGGQMALPESSEGDEGGR